MRAIFAAACRSEKQGVAVRRFGPDAVQKFLGLVEAPHAPRKLIAVILR